MLPAHLGHKFADRQRVQALLALPTEGAAALLFDDTGFAKQGKASVGVARQYSGTLGQVGNCQVTANCHYAERTLAWPVATRLYLGKEWAHDEARRHKAKVPRDVTFQTRQATALDLLDQADSWGVPYARVEIISPFGSAPGPTKRAASTRRRWT